MTIDDVIDHTAIRLVIERYCRGVDRRDKSLLDSVYWPGAIDDHGLYVGLGTEFAEFLFPAFAGYEATMHVVNQSNIELSGNSAVGDTYFIAGHRNVTNGIVGFLTAWGRYIDRFEKRDDEWRIASRRVIIEHLSQESGVEMGPMPLEHFQRGRHDRSDFSYEGRKA